RTADRIAHGQPSGTNVRQRVYGYVAGGYDVLAEGDHIMTRRRSGIHRVTAAVLWGMVLVLLCGTVSVSAAAAPAAPPQAPSLQQLFKQNPPAVVLFTQLAAC